MKTRTKLLALVLTLAMLVSVFAAFPVNAAMTTAVFQVDAGNVKDGGTAGTYNFVTAVTNVKDGGTIKMVGNAITTDRDDVSSMDKSYTVDGAKNDGSGENWTWTRSSAGTNSIAKFGGSGKTITFKNINFHSENMCQILETGGSGVILDLREGVKFTAASGSFTNGGIMLNVGTTLHLNGAV
ncbi:MAG: hypothetical protein IJW44_01625, partial [Clostridia bacterium]|nr:hypothetical protein [Clostridia bacterium]